MQTKHKFLFALVMVTILALACSLTPDQETPIPQVPQGQLETMVAQTVAAASANQPPTATQQSVVLPTDEPPTQEVPTQELPSDTPTETPTETPTQTPEPENTPVVGIADLKLGSPDDTMDFDSAYPFFTYSAANDEAKVQDGKYLFTIEDPISYSIWVFSDLTPKNFYFEVSIQMPDACAGKDRAGLIFGTPTDSYEEGYLFQISCDGNYRLTAYDGSDTTTLAKWTESNAIKEGPGKTNRIGVHVDGKNITLYINGTKMETVKDTMYTGSKGKLGFSIGVEDTPNFTVKFDDGAYWKLP